MLELRHIHKDYYVDNEPFPALKDVSLSFPDSGFVSILGPSGCGKTTLLNIIGGLDHYTSGDLLIDGKSTKGFKDADWDAYRNEHVGFVFQSYNLIPHISVLANVETSLLLNGAPHAERAKKAEAALEAVGLQGNYKKRPNQLSGGQMQRVALARAIVNDPSIILADEPTGALDSATSVQVMDILKELSKKRLVIMVTHNQELAERYSDRIIRIKDGEVVGDTKDYQPVSKPAEEERMKTKKTSMSFWSALKNAVSNLRTKKTRTFLTAFASSIGIFGVALVLAVSNGFQIYVDNVEGSMASSVPITISRMSYTTNTVSTPLPPEYPTDDMLNVYDSSTTTYVVHTNYYDKEYIDNVVNPLVDQGLARSVLVNRDGLSFNLLKKVHSNETGLDSYLRIDQTRSAGGISGAVSSLTGLPTTIFHELFGEEKGVRSMYDCIYGKYPTSSDELVLIVDRYNRVDLSTLRDLGLIAKDDDKTTSVSFEDLFANNVYKAYFNSSFYSKQEESEKHFPGYLSVKPRLENGQIVLEGDAGDGSYQKSIKRVVYDGNYGNIYNDDATYSPKTLKLVGVLRPSKESYLQLMPTSIGYLSSLKDEFVEDAEQNCDFLHEANENSWYIPTGYSGSQYTAANDGLPKLQSAFNEILTAVSGGGSGLSTDLVSKISDALAYTYSNVTLEKRNTLYSIGNSSYLWEARKGGADFREDLVGRFVDRLNYGTAEEKKSAMTAFLERILESSFYSNGHEKATYDVDGDRLDMDFNLIDLVAYFKSYSLISSILIFPASLTTKEALKAELDAYNNKQTNESKKVIYSDVMESFTSSLSVMIQVLSIVLIVFASISLVVSSVMTSIITYVSVIERTKEIGILRACGARKKDVGRLFEAECVIVGFVAGLIGILFGYLACPIIGVIVDSIYPGNNLTSIAQLNPLHALILLALSVLLALLSGLIPSRLGAKKDPVIALRSE